MIGRITKFTVLSTVVGVLLWGLVQLKESGIEVNRDAGSTAQQDTSRVIVVEIAADDSLSIAGKAIDPQGLEEHFRAANETDSKPPRIVIEVNGKAKNSTLIYVMEVAKNAETTSIAIRTD